MTERIVPSGIEANFIESWGYWDEVDTMHLVFQDSIVKDMFDIPTDVSYDVSMDFNSNIIEIYSREDAPKVMFSGKFAVSLVN